MHGHGLTSGSSQIDNGYSELDVVAGLMSILWHYCSISLLATFDAI